MSLPRLILATVFLTGAAVLVVEVAATRILAAYFGSTIYTVSSVLSVILAALSIGYALGGRLADRRPDVSLFFRLITLAGLGVLLLRLLTVTVLPYFGRELDLIWGPLLSAAVLFTIPSVLLGLLSPFAIALLQRGGQAPGATAGTVYAISTVGSIVGSLLAGFVLIPHFGLRAIILGTAAALIVLGVVGPVAHQLRPNLRLSIVAVIIGSLVATLPTPALFAGAIHQADGRYDRLTVFDSDYRGRPARYLAQDQNASSAAYLDEPGKLVFDYTQFAELIPLLRPEAKRLMAVGGGAYSIPQYLLQQLPQSQIDVAETDPALYGLARRHFNVSANDRLHNHIIDGRRMLSQQPGTYDAIFLDAYSSGHTVPAHLITKEFFQTAKAAATPNGLVLANVIGSLEPRRTSYLLSAAKTWQTVFPNSAIVAVESPNSESQQNFIFIGVNGDRPLDLPGLAPNHSIARRAYAGSVNLDGRLDQQLLFRDDFVPAEYLIARSIER